MNQPVETKLEKTILETWATLDFRAEKWGVERIAFDAVQNHFPEDCGGTNYYIVFIQDGTSVDFRNYDPTKPVERIQFSDNGIGYDSIYTVLRHSNKKDRETQSGKFGEGLKMISAAALRHNVDIVFRSQNWSARPRRRKTRIDGENKELELLCQEVITGYEKRTGSFTIFRNPSPELIAEILSFKERIIDFRADLPPTVIKGLHPQHRAFQPKKAFEGELFVRKIKYKIEKPLYLSYQINGEIADSLLTPDRDQVIKYPLDVALSHIIINFNQLDLIKSLVDVRTPDCWEKSILFVEKTEVSHPELWKQAFYELYGPKAVLEEPGHQKHTNLIAQNLGYNVVAGIPHGLKNLLASAGIKKASEVLNYRPSYDFLPVEALTEEQREIYQKHTVVNELLFGNQFAVDLHLFSRAYDANGEVKWFLGISDYSKEKPDIKLTASLLENPRQHIPKETLGHLESMIASGSIQNPERFLKEVAFLAAYAHEAIHVKERAVDGEILFEEGLTFALGIALAVYFRNQPKTY